MIDIDYFRTINGSINYKNEKEYRIDKIAGSYNKTYDKTLSTFQVLKRTKRIDKGYIHTPYKIKSEIEAEIDCVIDYKRVKKDTDNGFSRELWTDLNTVKTGDYIRYINRNSNEEQMYIIKSPIESKRDYASSMIQECNNTLVFMNDKQIYEFPCIITSKTLYSDGLDERLQIQLKDDLFGVWVQSNEITSLLKEDMNLIFKSQFGRYNKVRITLINDFSNKGITMIIGKSTELSKKDNLVLCIADYYDDNNNPPEITNPPIDPPQSSHTIKGDATAYRTKSKQYIVVDDKEVKAIDKWIFTVDKDIVEIKVIDDATVELTPKDSGNIVLATTNGTETITKNITCKMRF